ncbi:class I adenylate-forming enzyme family protein [Roseobacter sp. HKCCA0434]|uniref:class I adenylate-forming enzyme family protein n=1 Tax=Roseobacter sp. HKCCA0434 TaxID=3079297 RepID=UPI002905DF0F|nr:AMP-binding protein [Roseobacter sp. HKCCA0434]
MPSLHRDTPPPCPAPFNMAEHVMQAGRATPDRTALEIVETPGTVAERWTFGELDTAIGRAAGALGAAGVARGDRVALRLGNSVDFPLAFFGAQRLGAVPVALSAQLTAAELAPMLADLQPSHVVRDPDLPLPPLDIPILDPAALRTGDDIPAVETRPDDPAYIVFTSGSSGRPRAVVHAHRAAHARRMMWHDWYGLTPSDRMLHAGAFNWTFTLGTGLTDPWAAGAQAIIYTGPVEADTHVRLIAEHAPTIFAAVPGLYRRMLRQPNLAAATRSLRHGLSAGEALAPSLRAAWRQATGTDLHEALGMSEVSTYISSSPDRPAPEGATGCPQTGRQVAVLGEDDQPLPRGEAGELAVHRSDPGLMLGYLGGDPLPEWFRTGDRVEMGADGAIRYLGRLDDLMTVGGYRISPLEVEQALTACDGVAEAGVCAIRLSDDLSILAAFLIGTPRDVSEDLAARLASYKRPRHIQWVADLPRGATGKLNRRALPALYDPKGAP